MLDKLEIIEFLRDYSGLESIDENTDLFDAGITGDDFHDLIDLYWQKYQVDMSNYKWYFHCDEEGHSLGSIFYKPIYKRFNRITITPKLLFLFAKEGKWEIEYPEHRLPKRRWDIIINQVVTGLFVIIIVYKIINWIIG